MARFEAAGFRLGDVDRRADDRHPVGRLELNCLCKITHSRSKRDSIRRKDWPDVDLSQVDVAKCFLAWRDFLLSKGFDYWIVVTRNTDYELRKYPHDDHIRTGKPFTVTQYREVLRCESSSA